MASNVPDCNIQSGEFLCNIFLSPPMPREELDIVIRVCYPFGCHTFQKLTSLMLVFGLEPDDALNLRCWNDELQLKVSNEGVNVGRQFQNDILGLGITHLNYVQKLRDLLHVFPYFLHWE